MTEILIAIYCLGYIVACIFISSTFIYDLTNYRQDDKRREGMKLLPIIIVTMLASLLSWLIVILLFESMRNIIKMECYNEE